MPAVPRIEAAALYVHELRNLQRQGRHRRRGILGQCYVPDVIRVQSSAVITIQRHAMREARSGPGRQGVSTRFFSSLSVDR